MQEATDTLRRRRKAWAFLGVLALLLIWSVFVTVSYDTYKETKNYNELHAFTIKDFNPKLYETDEGLVLRFSGDKEIENLQIAASVWLQRSGGGNKIAYRFLLVRNVDLTEGVQFFVQPPMMFDGKMSAVGADITLFYNGQPFEFPPVILKTYEKGK